MCNLNYCITRFILSAYKIFQLPTDIGIEIAFAGRSNAGKSSAINTLTNQKKLAYTSKSPGNTQSINVFQIIEGKRLTDLPGYGYSIASKEIRRTCSNVLPKYIQKRQSLKGLIILMDIRHPLTDIDNQVIKLATQRNIPIMILLTKADKLMSNAIKAQLNMVLYKLSFMFTADIQVEIFSSLKKIGVNKLQQKLNTWFSDPYINQI
ncbi:ribosome biogenesis GTP-binding protein YihA/YsxC [Pantoea sp. Mhis]|uniref:ribosome biogenesis GTP-binding protein YihA/YsxC n=1 Tax=Pantoea sp. Mhis TaxID=2576759 RepID=UPI00135975C5|nr:ribosome biogenesis GTP-binding protein YihA/YsxC [Pantoea sp. Mhis]MXP56668.1 YihA family ribosome biogenesis GTP-binding protein [Pantoea sp. Mhis]